jgi:hypothetical protein
MNRSAAVHPRMLESLRGFFAHTCAVQARTDIQTATGSPRPSWATRTGLEAVRCRRSVASLSAGGREVRTAAIAAIEQNDYVIVLDGFFPQITARDSVLWEDGKTRYDVQIVNHDSASALTYLMVRVVQPIADPGV